MISFICGQVADTTENSVIIETGGIGYEVFMTGTAIEQAVRMEGKVKVHTYFHVREDAMQLYGFLEQGRSADVPPSSRCQRNRAEGRAWEFLQDLLQMNCGLRFSLTMSEAHFQSAGNR